MGLLRTPTILDIQHFIFPIHFKGFHRLPVPKGEEAGHYTEHYCTVLLYCRKKQSS